MYSLKLKCKVITPMFMAGADGRTPELRPSEFKGMMRWWWRAMRAEDDIERLKKEEANIFGGTGESEGRSKVKISITNLNNIKVGENVRDEIRDYEGLKYLYYSTFTLRSRGEPIIRKFFKPDLQFEIKLTSFIEESFKIASASLWLAIYLGGFGTRARRGGGNLEVINTEGISDIQFKCEVSNTQQLRDFIDSNIAKIKQFCQQGNETKKYTTLRNANILLFKPKNNWKDALNFLGDRYKNFRHNNKSKIFETAAFGMPVMHSGFSVRMVPYESNSILSDRWASPLIFKVIKSGKLYFPIIVKLSGGGINFIGKEIKRDGKWVLDNRQVKPANEILLKEFLNSLPKAEVLTL